MPSPPNRPASSPPYASAYALPTHRTAAASPALVLAPGTHTTRLGFAGAALPAATLSSAALPLSPPGAFASALALAAAAHLQLSSAHLPSHALIIATPPANLPRAAAAAAAAAAIRLLRMRAAVLVPAAPAAALAAGASHGGALALVVDVGWAGARVCVGAHGAAVAAAPAGMRDVAAALRDAGVAAAEVEAAMAVVYVRPPCGDIDDRDGGDAVGDDGRVVVPARARWTACEVLFAGGLLIDAVVDALRGRDVYTRAAGARCVVACGGAAGVPGFAARLQRDLAAALDKSVGVGVGARVRVLCSGPAAAWIGGSLLGCVGPDRYGECVEVVEAEAEPEPRGAEEVEERT